MPLRNCLVKHFAEHTLAFIDFRSSRYVFLASTALDSGPILQSTSSRPYLKPVDLCRSSATVARGGTTPTWTTSFQAFWRHWIANCKRTSKEDHTRFSIWADHVQLKR